MELLSGRSIIDIMRGFGSATQKVLLLLLGGTAIAFSYSPTRARRVLRAVTSEWKNINRRELGRAIHRLYESKLIYYKEEKDGAVSIVLNREGKKVALRYKLDELSILKPQHWDRRWRVILFDIPETERALRDSLRSRLRQLGTMEFQKSVFVHPYDCRDEVDFIIEVYNARRYVRFIEAVHIDNEFHLKRKFHLR